MQLCLLPITSSPVPISPLRYFFSLSLLSRFRNLLSFQLLRLSCYLLSSFLYLSLLSPIQISPSRCSIPPTVSSQSLFHPPFRYFLAPLPSSLSSLSLSLSFFLSLFLTVSWYFFLPNSTLSLCCYFFLLWSIRKFRLSLL